MRQPSFLLCSLFCVLWGAPCAVAGNNPPQQIKPPQWTINDGARICFQHPLPAMRVNGKPGGLYNNPEVGLPGVLTTRDSALGEMILKLRQTINNERRLVFVDVRYILTDAGMRYRVVSPAKVLHTPLLLPAG